VSSAKLGVKDFLAMTDEFHPEWSVFAVEASIEQVEDALSMLQSRKPDSNVSIHLQKIDGSLDDKLKGREFAYVVPVVQLSHSSWVVVYWEVFHGGMTSRDRAGAMSAKLSTRAISLFTEDTSDVLGYVLFDKGDRLEEAQCCSQDGEGITYWKSQLRSKPELEFLDGMDDEFDGDDEDYDKEEERINNHNEGIWCDFVNTVFSDWGVYLPAFYPIQQASDVRVEVETDSEESIERMDLLYLAKN
jgi:hypothetical protein